MASDLQTIPFVGKRTEAALQKIGIHTVADLRGQSPEELYQKDCLQRGFQVDRCQLYLFRLAVYYAEQEIHEPEKLKWWYWKNRPYPPKTDDK